jgi:hypothetical protein
MDLECFDGFVCVGVCVWVWVWGGGVGVCVCVGVSVGGHKAKKECNNPQPRHEQASCSSLLLHEAPAQKQSTKLTGTILMLKSSSEV